MFEIHLIKKKSQIMCYKHDQFVGEPGSETYRRFFVFCGDLPRHELASLSKGSSESGHSGIHGE